MPVDGDIILKAGLDTAGVTKSIHNLSKSISKSLKNAIRIGFGVRSIFALIRKLRTALFEGFKDLAQVHAPFNEAMSEIMTSLRLLRNTFAAAFAPIVETVAPILSSFINLMAKAIASVGQFIAALTGKEYVQAGTVQVDYAESVNKSAKSTDKATSATKKQTKAQKELNKEITHFDDLVILHSNRDDDDTTEPVTTSTPQSAFTTMPIGNAVSQFVKDFKAAWANADFTDIGRQVGEKLKNALENIPWTDIKATLAKIGKSIATFLNGFMETPGLYYTIGKTIAEGINSAFEFVYAFVSNFHWDSWGRAIQDKILGLLENIDWQLIYNTMTTLASGLGTALSTAFTNSKLWTSIFYSLANGINVLVSSLQSFLNAVQWRDLGDSITTGLRNGMYAIRWRDVYALAGNFGTSLANFLNGLFNPNTFAEVGATVSRLLNSAFEFLNHFGETFDFKNFGSSLAAGINGFLNNFNIARLTSGINTLVTGFRDAIVSFLGKVNWYDFGVKLREIIKNIPWKIILLSVGTVIWEALNSAIKLLNGLFNIDNITSPFTKAIGKIKTAVDDAASKINFNKIADGIDRIVKALAPAGTGFGVGFIHFFEAIIKGGTLLLTLLGPCLQMVANAVMSIDPDILNSVGIALGVFAGALVTINGLNALAGIIAGIAGPLPDLIAGLAAHPLLAIGAGLVAVSAGLKNLCDSGFFADADSKAAIQNANEVIKSADSVKQSVQGVLDEAQMKNRDIQATFKTLGDLADDYFDLAEKEKLSNEEQQKFEDLRATLSSNLPGFTEIINNTAASYSEQRQSVNDLITSTENYYKTLAAEEFLKDYYTQLFALQVEITKNRDAYDQLVASYDGSVRTGDLIHDTWANITDAFDGTQAAIDRTDAEYVELTNQVDELNALYEAAIKVTEDYGTAEENAATSASNLTQSQQELGESAKESSTNTSSVGEALGQFDGLSLKTPFKLALISAAINALSDSNKITDEQAQNLQSTLDSYNPQKPTSSMNKIQKAFEDAGVSGDDFSTEIEKAAKSTIADFESMSKSGKTNFEGIENSAKKSGKNVSKGFVEESKKGQVEIKKEMKSSAEGAISEFDEGLGNNSPSRKTRESADNVISGFVLGINNSLSSATEAMSSLAQQILTAFDSYQSSYITIGQNIVSNIAVGVSDSYYALLNVINQISYSMQNSFDTSSWESLGRNIGLGIYNGLFYYSGTLEVLAWNTAVDMYNSACRALSIASPSKKFAYIGEMVAKGLGKGVEDNQDVATDAVVDMTDAMTAEAEKTNPTVAITSSIDNWINSLDDVLTTFSETIIDKFDAMMSTLIQLGNVSGYIPAVAQGKVIPSSVRASSNSSNNTANMMRMLENLTANQMTTEDLRPLLIELFRDYMNFGWYIGDEQLARHVNNGNLSLGRRYSK